MFKLKIKLNIFLFLIILFFSSSSIAHEEDSIRVQIELLQNKSLTSGWLEKYDSVKSKLLEFKIINNRFSFALPSTTIPGVYRLHLDMTNDRPYVDIIIDGNEPKILCSLRIHRDETYPIFHESRENKNWYDYLTKAKMMIYRLDMLFDYLSNFHTKGYRTDSTVTKAYQNERKRYYLLFNEFIEANKNNWSGLLVKNRPYYYSDLYNEPIERDFIRKDFFWEGIDTNSNKLIHTPLYEELINTFLDKYYLNPIETFTPEQKEFNFRKAILILINKFSSNVSTKYYIKEFLKKYVIELNRPDLVSFIEHEDSVN